MEDHEISYTHIDNQLYVCASSGLNSWYSLGTIEKIPKSEKVKLIPKYGNIILQYDISAYRYYLNQKPKEAFYFFLSSSNNYRRLAMRTHVVIDGLPTQIIIDEKDCYSCISEKSHFASLKDLMSAYSNKQFIIRQTGFETYQVLLFEAYKS